MIKLITIFLIIISSPIFSENLLNSHEVCKYFKVKDENNKKFNPYTGKTNIKFKEDGIYECKNSNTSFRIFIPRYFYIEDLYISGNLIIEVKDKKMIRFEVRDENRLQFSAQYNKYGPNGKMFSYKGFGLGNSHILEINFKDGKPFGDILEYYDNGNLYRKSHLVKGNNYYPFSTPDDYNKYIDYYEIYDINTGEILKKESLVNKTGTVWDYDSKNGKLYKESHLVNGEIIFQREYKEDGTVAQEYNYKK